MPHDQQNEMKTICCNVIIDFFATKKCSILQCLFGCKFHVNINKQINTIINWIEQIMQWMQLHPLIPNKNLWHKNIHLTFYIDRMMSTILNNKNKKKSNKSLSVINWTEISSLNLYDLRMFEMLIEKPRKRKKFPHYFSFFV